MIRVLVCEDDLVTKKVNSAYIEALSEKFKIKIELVTSDNGKNVSGKYFDIAFLDIDLGIDNGIDIAREILKHNKGAAIIFVTVHSEYALDACKIQCFGYILKPINQEEFEKIYAKALIQVKSLKNRSFEEQLSFCTERKQYLINQNEIIYVERVQRKINIVTMTKEYYVNDSLHSILKKLTSYFVQLNQGVIVNAREIQSLEGNVVYMKTGQQFKIGRAFKTVKGTYQNLVR